jgi:hypothetical protein
MLWREEGYIPLFEDPYQGHACHESSNMSEKRDPSTVRSQ